MAGTPLSDGGVLAFCSWLLEEASTSTRTNAWYSLDIVAAAQQQRQQQQQEQQQDKPALLIITSPFHQLRSYYTFRRAALQKGLSIQVCAGLPGGLNCELGRHCLQLQGQPPSSTGCCT